MKGQVIEMMDNKDKEILIAMCKRQWEDEEERKDIINIFEVETLEEYIEWQIEFNEYED